ncbi:hypothetical protein ACP4OV_031508 [Aristida adscensionis]
MLPANPNTQAQPEEIKRKPCKPLLVLSQQQLDPAVAMAAPSPRTVTAFVVVVFFVLLVASPTLLHAARAMPRDGQEVTAAARPETTASLLQERPAMMPPPPPSAAATAIGDEAGRGRVLGSVPSPGVGH